MVQGCWSWIQDPVGSYPWYLHRCVYTFVTFGSESLWLYLFSDKKCPFTGNISIRGRILTGKVVSTKMTRTIVIRRDYLHYIPKYSALEDNCCTFALNYL